jgi:hypothetical protein
MSTCPRCVQKKQKKVVAPLRGLSSVPAASCVSPLHDAPFFFGRDAQLGKMGRLEYVKDKKEAADRPVIL